ncbi:MAG: ARMT1-like domain-containing protein [Cyanobacteria bacterium J06558_2]
MNQLLRPKLTIPPQLSVSESGSFARYTFTHRVPAIIHQVIAENNYDDSIVNQLEALAQNLLQEQVCSLDNDGGTDLAAWTEYIAPHKAKYWLDAPFYFIESYFYRRLLQITAYFSLKPEQKIDPFELQKRLDLVKSMKLVRLEVQQHRQSLSDSADKQDPSWQQTLMNLLYLNLWGNRADLSLKPTRAGDFNHEQMSTQPQTESIILNDAAQVVNYLSQGNQQRIDFIVDNAGWELISDLLLVDFLLASNAVNVVHLHLKGHPIFVSDAMIKDVEETIDLLAKDQETAVREFATSLQNHLASGRLILQDHPLMKTRLD